MRTRSEVSAEKLRGGFYTPPRLVRHAVERLEQLLPTASGLRLLEPSIGDGAFIDGVAASDLNVSELVGVELLASEASKAANRLTRASICGQILNTSTLSWALTVKDRPFDAVIGNLPFVRFQFVSESDRRSAAVHGAELGLNLAGVSNLWVPMFFASLRLVRTGGAFVLVLPAECLTGVSAGAARQWLLEHTESLRCDLYPAGSFPGALQEVVLVSGRIIDFQAAPELTVALHPRSHSCDNFLDSDAVAHAHVLRATPRSWTRLLLAPGHLQAFEEFENLPAVQALGSSAKFEVSTVTGANSFFSVTSRDVTRYKLGHWVRPLLPRTRYAQGLVFDQIDFESIVDSDVPAFLLDTSLQPYDRRRDAGLDQYLATGEAQELHLRYKCRIRSPWWSVPVVSNGQLLLSKRCHRGPRMIVNDTNAVTTDTIYRGRLLSSNVDSRTLVAGFHNSGTLLSTELEGRNFGGGVLELVPSEVARLSVPYAEKLASEFQYLDKVARDGVADTDSSERLQHETDLLVRKAGIGVTSSMLDNLESARALLLGRRLDRGSVVRDTAC